jgi:outer membrane protein OmpA-like peptidoglycan-associated protein
MKERLRLLLVILLLAGITAKCHASSDWYNTISVRLGRTGADCDVESTEKSLAMFGGQYEIWYNNLFSIGPYFYLSQLHGGKRSWDYTVNPDQTDPILRGFRAYVAGLDIKLKFRPHWDWSNIMLPDHSISRIAPYVNAGAGIITFDPLDRSGTQITGDYKRHAGAAPVFGAGLTFFSRMGVTADLGMEYHFVNSDELDGFKYGKTKDRFWTGYIALTIGSSKPVEPPVLPPEPEPQPEPEPIIEPEPEPEPVPIPEPVPEPIKREPAIEIRKDVSLIIKGVTFKTDKDELTASAMVELDKLVIVLTEDYPDITLDIQGHTDSDASDAYNMDLSRRRSLSVKRYLVSKGVAENRLTTSWFGERRPIAPNTTPAGKAQNRRIEFIRTD